MFGFCSLGPSTRWLFFPRGGLHLTMLDRLLCPALFPARAVEIAARDVRRWMGGGGERYLAQVF